MLLSGGEVSALFSIGAFRCVTHAEHTFGQQQSFDQRPVGVPDVRDAQGEDLGAL